MLRLIAILAILSVAVVGMTDSTEIGVGVFVLGALWLLLSLWASSQKRHAVLRVLWDEYRYAVRPNETEELDDLIADLRDVGANEYDIATVFMAAHIDGLAVMATGEDPGFATSDFVRDTAVRAGRLESARKLYIADSYLALRRAVQRYHVAMNPGVANG